MKITMLGTGNALVTECYNTCYVLSGREGHVLVDGGGGSAILKQLKTAGIEAGEIHHVIVTHKHIDHLLGIIWVIRVICQGMNGGTYQGDAFIYAHQELAELIEQLSRTLLNKKEIKRIGERLHIVPVGDGEKKRFWDTPIRFLISDRRRQNSLVISWSWTTDADLSAAGTSRAGREDLLMQRTATGFFMRHFVSRLRKQFFIRTKNIILPFRMPVSWQNGWG